MIHSPSQAPSQKGLGRELTYIFLLFFYLDSRPTLSLANSPVNFEIAINSIKLPCVTSVMLGEEERTDRSARVSIILTRRDRFTCPCREALLLFRRDNKLTKWQQSGSKGDSEGNCGAGNKDGSPQPLRPLPRDSTN